MRPYDHRMTVLSHTCISQLVHAEVPHTKGEAYRFSEAVLLHMHDSWYADACSVQLCGQSPDAHKVEEETLRGGYETPLETNIRDIEQGLVLDTETIRD